jgi:hypothetical protein
LGSVGGHIGERAFVRPDRKQIYHGTRDDLRYP